MFARFLEIMKLALKDSTQAIGNNVRHHQCVVEGRVMKAIKIHDVSTNENMHVDIIGESQCLASELPLTRIIRPELVPVKVKYGLEGTPQSEGSTFEREAQ